MKEYVNTIYYRLNIIIDGFNIWNDNQNSCVMKKYVNYN